VFNPLAKGSVMAQRLSNTKAKITGVRIHKPGADSSITSVAVNQCQLVFAHLPSLLQDLGERPVEHDFSRMIAVKVNLHRLPLASLISVRTTMLAPSNSRRSRSGLGSPPGSMLIL
jgi:hypothetical protein